MHAPLAYRRLGSSSGIRCHAVHSRHQHGLGISFQREYFLCAGLRFVSSQQLGLLLICSLFGYGFANASCASDFAFPLGLRCCVGFYTHVLIQSFSSRFQLRHSLPLHSHVGYRHQVHIRGSSAVCSSAQAIIL